MTDHDAPQHDDDELELQPIDPEIVEHQRQRTKRKVREAEDSVDINEVFDEENIGDPVDLEQLKHFRFTTRHLMIATAVVAIVMTLFLRLDGCMGLFVSACIALGAGWWFVLREEQRRLGRLAANRKKLKQRIASQRAIEDDESVPASKVKKLSHAHAEVDADREEDNTQPSFRISFSMKELLVAFTVAAVMLGCSQILGFENAAMLLGFVALVGLLAQAFGVELPPLVVLGWWLLLVLYILICLWAVAFGSAEPV